MYGGVLNGGTEVGGGGWLCGGEALPQICVPVRWESALGGLDGRQRQDAAIVGVEVLRVAPRPKNRQQGLRIR